MTSLAGHVLIASPYMGDGNFNKSVVLIIQHDEDGATGVILNRPSSQTVGEIWQQVGGVPADCNEFINIGGPVDGVLIALHTQAQLSEIQVFSGVHVATARDHLNELVGQDKAPFRVYGGYSGWGPQQLESELEQGAWLTKPAKFEYVFCDSSSDLWQEVSRDFGKENILDTLRIRHIPTDPSLN